MSDNIQNLANKDAVEKLQKLAKEKTGHFTTFLNTFDISSRPMYTQGIDEYGDFWFFSYSDSNKNNEIRLNNKVNLLYAMESSDAYLFVKGSATILYDKNKIDELWSPFVKTWFPEGKDDPKLSLIRVTPVESYYWDTKNNKAVSLAKIAWSTVTGGTSDDGREGKILV